MLEAVARLEGLRVVDMAFVNLSSMDPGQLARVVARQEEVDIFETQFTRKQLKAILTVIKSRDSRLKKLSISVDNLSTWGLGLLTSAMNRLEEVGLLGLDLSVKQWEEFLTALDEEDSRLKKLSPMPNVSNINLSKVDPCLKAGGGGPGPEHSAVGGNSNSHRQGLL